MLVAEVGSMAGSSLLPPVWVSSAGGEGDPNVKQKKNPKLIKIKLEIGDATIKLALPRRWLVALLVGAFGKIGLWLGG